MTQHVDETAGTGDPAWLTCTVCHREVPASASVSAEAIDYVVHFCGIDCYDRWRESAGRNPAGSSA